MRRCGAHEEEKQECKRDDLQPVNDTCCYHDRIYFEVDKRFEYVKVRKKEEKGPSVNRVAGAGACSSYIQAKNQSKKTRYRDKRLQTSNLYWVKIIHRSLKAMFTPP